MPQLAQDPEAAVSIADKVGYPVVIKVVSPDISHKSDVVASSWESIQAQP